MNLIAQNDKIQSLSIMQSHIIIKIEKKEGGNYGESL